MKKYFLMIMILVIFTISRVFAANNRLSEETYCQYTIKDGNYIIVGDCNVEATLENDVLIFKEGSFVNGYDLNNHNYYGNVQDPFSPNKMLSVNDASNFDYLFLKLVDSSYAEPLLFSNDEPISKITSSTNNIYGNVHDYAYYCRVGGANWCKKPKNVEYYSIVVDPGVCIYYDYSTLSATAYENINIDYWFSSKRSSSVPYTECDGFGSCSFKDDTQIDSLVFFFRLAGKTNGFNYCPAIKKPSKASVSDDE